MRSKWSLATLSVSALLTIHQLCKLGLGLSKGEGCGERLVAGEEAQVRNVGTIGA